MTTLGSYAAYIALLSVLSGVLAALAVWLTSLQARVYLAGLKRFLVPLRRRRAHNEGLNPRDGVLRQLAREEALQLITGGPIEEPKDRAKVHARLPRWGVNLAARISQALSHPEVLADFVDRKKDRGRKHILDALLVHAHRLRRWWIYVLFVMTALAAAVVASTAQYFATPELPFAVLAAIVLCTLPAAIAINRVMTVSAGLYEAGTRSRGSGLSLPPQDTDPKAEEPIGRKGDFIRAINFSSGGFDTLMQLGVIHALVVIRGRSPDIVTGLSSRRIQRGRARGSPAGGRRRREGLPQESTRRFQLLSDAEQATLQRIRLLARVERLRRFIEAAQNAPERLLDAVLPDAYQIDAGRPLYPLQQPRFSPDEREQRAEFLSRRSGLAHLYNDLLSIPLSLGTLTKVAWRLLGRIAAAEISDRMTRWAVRLIEGMRLWLLFGANLVQAALVVPILLRIYRRPPKSTPGTAGAVIFRSRFLRGLRRFIEYGISFVFLFTTWLAISLILYPLCLLLALVFAGAVLVRERAEPLMRSIAWDGLQGMAGWLCALLLWGALAAAIVIAIAQPTPTTWQQSIYAYRYTIGVPYAAIVLIGILLGIVVWLDIRWHRWSYADRLLASYNLGGALFQDHGLRTFLSELFDPSYFVRPSMQRAVKAALESDMTGKPHPDDGAAKRRALSEYSDKERIEPIHVALAVANTEDGGLDVVPPDTSIIDGLMAATAATPWLPPVELTKRTKDGHLRKILYIDGANVTREPTHALMNLLRGRRNPESKTAYVYSVAPFPISKPELGEVRRPAMRGDQSTERPEHFLNLVDIVWRAWRLRRFRDAALERRLTELFTSVIPSSVQEMTVGERETYLRAWVTPVELEYDADLNRRLANASKDDRRRIIEETIADGCRAALQVMIPDGIASAAQVIPDGIASAPEAPLTGPRHAKCARAVESHLASRTGVPTAVTEVPLPGSAPNIGPGLSEICKRCCINATLKQTLRLDAWTNTGPPWPHEREPIRSEPEKERRFQQPEPERRSELRQAWENYGKSIKPEKRWPRSRPGTPGNQRPTISLLFSGGVFRGVYQVGVLNGLHQLGIKPDLIAGASVGSITAALIAKAFSIGSPEASEGVRLAQQKHIAWLAAIYLAIDRLVLSDRFSDFVRNLTVRASETRFSIRQADFVFRKYDYQGLGSFDRNARRVIAGIERLFYVSPYQLNDLVRALRTRSSDQVTKILRITVQKFLDRMQIGQEALGAEALEELIREFAVTSTPAQHRLGFTADDLRDETGIQFLATATNLTEGRLEVLGELPAAHREEGYVLKEALLASSAFPGIFRPRWSWELSSAPGKVQQFIDGGVMDNLPIDAIAQFLHRAAQKGIDLVARAPATPHLIIGASLEVTAPAYALAFTRRRFRTSWIALGRRARQLGYNGKLDMYHKVEQALRKIDRSVTENPAKFPASQSDLVHIHLMAIKPNWLCGTFAFHPMLGFRRNNQARSIAHGCASTLLQFARFEADGGDKQLRHWGIDPKAVPRVSTWSAAFDRLEGKRPDRHDDRCWLRDCACPFSSTYLHQNQPDLPGTVVDEVSRIHEFCKQRSTHLRTI